MDVAVRAGDGNGQTRESSSGSHVDQGERGGGKVGQKEKNRQMLVLPRNSLNVSGATKLIRACHFERRAWHLPDDPVFHVKR